MYRDKVSAYVCTLCVRGRELEKERERRERGTTTFWCWFERR